MTMSLDTFLDLVKQSAGKNELAKLTLGDKRKKGTDLRNVFIKPVALKNGYHLSFVYRHATKDITKNFDITESIKIIRQLLEQDFYNADLFTTANNYHLLQKNDNVKIVTKPATNTSITQLHNREKKRIIQSINNIYLHHLGITTREGTVKKDMQDKYKQINRYTEIIDGIIKDLSFTDSISIVDMGSGKGYLTFALYDYIVNTLHKKANITGIEIRPDLVNACNNIATASGFGGLHFEKGSIADHELTYTDILIALHACDTATDDAIYKGIKANAKVIVVAPCCHKQIRKQMKPSNALASITKHGILLERQAEMVTDSIRALLMEANGYKTKVFEFINLDHTPKNVMIAGVKKEMTEENKKETIDKVIALKQLFNIEEHYLEKLLSA